MRLFLAIDFDPAVKQQLSAVRDRLAQAASAGRFSRQENFHITLAFLGDIPPSRIPAIRSCMEEVLHALVAGTDQLAAHGELLHAVGAPAGDAGHGEQGRVQLHGQAQHLVDEAAAVVKRIFALCAAGNGPSQIARILKKEQVLTPTMYAYAKYGMTHTGLDTQRPYHWSGDTVADMLENEIYIGNTLNYRFSSAIRTCPKINTPVIVI